jgi:uncharacterized protein YecE (DUF72 family)
MHPPQAVYFVGTSGWNYPDWRECFYPPDLPQKRWLEYYATRFRAVEINATFYRTFKDQTFRNWVARTPDPFRFVLKAPRHITHVKHLQDCVEEIRAFDRSAHLLAEKLGLILLQIAPDTPADLARLSSALSAFSQPTKVAIELRRHKRWAEDVVALLKDFGAAWVNADAPGNPLEDRITSEVGYLRLHGRRRWYDDLYTPEELEQIAVMAQQMAERGAKEIYIFFNNTVSGHAAHNALELQAQLR